MFKFKQCKNPWILDKISNSYIRQLTLSDIPYIANKDGNKGCIWCGDELKSKHHNTRYCKDNCDIATYIFGNPQSNFGLHYFLHNQNYKCKLCNYDYNKDLENITKNYKTKISEVFMSKLKKRLPLNLRPEVDHIIPILTGGSSLGFDNHQVLCYDCHKSKTKIDLKMPKRIKGDDEIKKNKKNKMTTKILDKLTIFMNNHWKSSNYSINMKLYKDIFLTHDLTYDELLFIKDEYADQSEAYKKELTISELDKIIERKKPLFDDLHI